MILEEETYKKFGYWPKDLSKTSHKKIVTRCDDCGKIREPRRENYCKLCHKCACRNEEYKKRRRDYKELDVKLKNHQITIVSDNDLSIYGYRKVGKPNGTQKWINVEYKKAYDKKLENRNGGKTKKYQKEWRKDNEIEVKKKKHEYYEKK